LTCLCGYKWLICSITDVASFWPSFFVVYGREPRSMQNVLEVCSLTDQGYGFGIQQVDQTLVWKAVCGMENAGQDILAALAVHCH
jgi:hypothetical protein